MQERQTSARKRSSTDSSHADDEQEGKLTDDVITHGAEAQGINVEIVFSVAVLVLPVHNCIRMNTNT